MTLDQISQQHTVWLPPSVQWPGSACVRERPGVGGCIPPRDHRHVRQNHEPCYFHPQLQVYPNSQPRLFFFLSYEMQSPSCSRRGHAAVAYRFAVFSEVPERPSPFPLFARLLQFLIETAFYRRHVPIHFISFHSLISSPRPNSHRSSTFPFVLPFSENALQLCRSDTDAAALSTHKIGRTAVPLAADLCDVLLRLSHAVRCSCQRNALQSAAHALLRSKHRVSSPAQQPLRRAFGINTEQTFGSTYSYRPSPPPLPSCKSQVVTTWEGACLLCVFPRESQSPLLFGAGLHCAAPTACDGRYTST